MRNVIANAKGACYELCVVVAISLVLGVFLSACSGEGGNFTNPNDEELAALSSAEGQGSSSSKTNGSGNSSGVTLSGASAESNGSSSSEQDAEPSSSENLPGSSSDSADDVESSSGERDTSQNSAEAKVMPSGTYDCTKYKCVTTEYLNQKYFEAGEYGEILDERDGQVYKTVQIEEQIWMAENLNYAIAKGSYCYDKSDDNCATYGRLYEWAYAMDRTMVGCGYGYNCDLGTGNVQGVCPDGWHVPTKSAWAKLFAAVGGQSTAGTKLKATTLWEAEEGFANEDAYGFSALSAGFMGPIGTFNGVGGYTAFFWSATQYDNNHAYNMYLSYDYGGAYQDYYSKSNSFSVRCLKD